MRTMSPQISTQVISKFDNFYFIFTKCFIFLFSLLLLFINVFFFDKLILSLKDLNLILGILQFLLEFCQKKMRSKKERNRGGNMSFWNVCCVLSLSSCLLYRSSNVISIIFSFIIKIHLNCIDKIKSWRNFIENLSSLVAIFEFSLGEWIIGLNIYGFAQR